MDNQDRFKEIRHNYDGKFHHSRTKWMKILKLPKLLVNEIIVDGLDNLRTPTTKLYLCNHISMADYMAIGYTFGIERIPMPRIASGKNLLVWPLNYFGFKRFGAFEIDRKNKTREYLYLQRDYVKSLLLNKEDVLIFLEGTRNIDKKLSNPKTGLLEGAILAEQETPNTIEVISCAVDYDKVVEKDFISFTRKFQRISKDPKTPKILRVLANYGYYLTDFSSFLKRPFVRNKGNVYLTFGKPKKLSEYLSPDKNPQENKKILAKKVIEEIKELLS